MFTTCIRVPWAAEAPFLDITGSQRLKGWHGSRDRICFLAWGRFLTPRLRKSCWLWSRSWGCHDVHASEDWEEESRDLEELHIGVCFEVFEI
jgi:hypothetical protein